MTVSTTSNRIAYTGNGVTTVYPFPYKFLATTDLRVYVDGVLLTITTDYSVGTPSDSGANVTFVTAPTGLASIVILADPDLLQSSQLPSTGPLPTSTIEKMVDKVTLQVQRLKDLIGRSIGFSDGDATAATATFPVAASRLGRMPVFNTTDGGVDVSSFTYTQVASAVAAAYASGSTADAVTFIQAGTGAVSRSVQSKEREAAVSVVDFGAVGDGATNNNTAFQACVTYCQANFRAMLIPAGDWLITTTINITGKLKIFGEGRYNTLVRMSGSTLVGFGVNTANAVEFHSMWLYGVTPGASNSAISLTGGAPGNLGSVFNDLIFDAFFDPFLTVSAYGWNISNCVFNNYSRRAATVRNAISPDSGDSTIERCLFSNPGAAGIGIYQRSSGGLRVLNNKINGGADGYLMDLDNGATTSILIITGNSIENQTTAGVRMVNTAGGGSFSQVNISGNQLSNQPLPIALNDASAFILGAIIADNTIVAMAGAGTTSAITATAVPRVSIDDNVIYGSGTTPVGITIGTLSTDEQEGNNLIYGCVTPVSKGNTLTAAAGVLTLPLGDDVFQVTNAGGNITSISPVKKGRTIKLMFTGALTVTDGSNLKLAGNFVTTADDTITLTCYDGTNWHEDQRSVN